MSHVLLPWCHHRVRHHAISRTPTAELPRKNTKVSDWRNESSSGKLQPVSLQDSFLDNILTKALVACSYPGIRTIKTLIGNTFCLKRILEESPWKKWLQNGCFRKLSQGNPGSSSAVSSTTGSPDSIISATLILVMCDIAQPAKLLSCYFFHIPIRNLLDSAVGQSFSQLLDDLHLLNKVSRLCVDDIVSPSHRSDFLRFWCYLALYFLANKTPRLCPEWLLACDKNVLWINCRCSSKIARAFSEAVISWSKDLGPITVFAENPARERERGREKKKANSKICRYFLPYLYDLSVYGKDGKAPVQIKSQRPDRKDAPQNIRTPWNVNVKLSK